ncbi:MAG TPA: sigma-70 family RNA polymerase sigma factor [Blastocatellia bacterium]
MTAGGDRINRVTRGIARLIKTGLNLRGQGRVDLNKTSGYALPVSETGCHKTSRGVMAIPSPDDVTQLLQEWRNGDKAALERLTPLVYDELRRLARNYLRGERKDHTLQGTALVNEAYMKLVGYTNLEWQNRAHFFGVAARVMRQILIDYARKHRSGKRGSGKQHMPLEEAAVFSADRAESLVALDDALESLARLDPAKGRIIELRYFGGLGIEEIAEVMAISVSSVRRHMRMAEAWLHREMTSE